MVKATGHKQTQAAQLVVAAGAGGASSLFSCPAELIMIQQQKTGRSLMTEAVSIFQRCVLLNCVCSCALNLAISRGTNSRQPTKCGQPRSMA